MQLLEDAKAGKFQRVIVAKLDRIARDTFYTLWIEKELKKCGVELYSVAEPGRWSDPTQKMLFTLISSFAEFEKSRITERLLAGRKKKLESGRFPGGRPPYGYTMKAGELIVNEKEAAVLRRMRKMRAQQHLSYRAIAKALDAEGIKTKSGAKWSARGVLYVLKNRKYRGEISYGDGTSRPGIHQPIR